MKFYDRIEELKVLEKNRIMAKEHSVMTTLIGRRRTGKTSLLLKSAEGTKYLYLYVSKDNEKVLCSKFQHQALQMLGLQIYGKIDSFRQLFEQLMQYGKNESYTLIIDEFQNLLNVNKAIPSEIQDIWDRYKDSTKVNFIACGSIYSMMKKIFENSDEPLYGRRDSNMKLLPFRINTLKDILADFNNKYTNEDLLCMYMLTGGVAKYVSLLMDNKATTKSKMIDYIFSSDSPFLTEGTELLISEFGKDYGTYFSILQLIADGKTSQSEIDSVIGKNTGAYLNNLTTDFSFISKQTPLFSKTGSRNIKWQIKDCFLRFWFRFIYPYQGLIESNQLTLLKNYVLDSYNQYSGKTLELYFHSKYMEKGLYTKVDNWWDNKGENEIDMIALNEFNHTGVIAEIKRNPRKISINDLENKISKLPSTEFGKYNFDICGLSIENM